MFSTKRAGLKFESFIRFRVLVDQLIPTLSRVVDRRETTDTRPVRPLIRHHDSSWHFVVALDCSPEPVLVTEDGFLLTIQVERERVLWMYCAIFDADVGLDRTGD